MVSGDTLSVVERCEEVVHSGRTRDAETVERMRTLLFEHTDVDSLVGGATADANADDGGE
jgi:hypothetical protein